MDTRTAVAPLRCHSATGGQRLGVPGESIRWIIGAFIGAWLLPPLGVRIGAGIVSAIVSATIGAVVLLLILRVVRRSGRLPATMNAIGTDPPRNRQPTLALGTFRVWLAVNAGASMSVTFGFPPVGLVWEVAAHPSGSASALVY